MNTHTIPYQIVDLTPGRRIWLNTLELSWTAHAIYGLLEVDVTIARKYIGEHKARTGESLSFTAFLAFCLARAVEEHKEVQACLKGRRQIVMFDDVNIGLMVEHKAGGKGALMGHVIQGANHKTYREIHKEIRTVQSAPVPSGRGMPSWFRSAMQLPGLLPRLTMALFRMKRRRDPLSFVSMGGTVAITSVGMFGGGHSGWGVTPTPQSLGLVVGGIAWKPAVVEGRIEPREMLNLTVMFDHDVVDGAPATRFTRRLVELIESGYGLEEMDEQ
ncbi:MAG: 2-oxo acid dehydrogenase subunit E2 [Chloroflexota bacterium]|nr:MAG: 2-oxo acid dehydrogenase subunit E2 [Chloroflexota bacterium]